MFERQPKKVVLDNWGTDKQGNAADVDIEDAGTLYARSYPG